MFLQVAICNRPEWQRTNEFVLRYVNFGHVKMLRIFCKGSGCYCWKRFYLL